MEATVQDFLLSRPNFDGFCSGPLYVGNGLVTVMRQGEEKSNTIWLGSKRTLICVKDLSLAVGSQGLKIQKEPVFFSIGIRLQHPNMVSPKVVEYTD